MKYNDIVVRQATEWDLVFAASITHEMEASAKARGSGISKRSPGSIKEKTEGRPGSNRGNKRRTRGRV